MNAADDDLDLLQKILEPCNGPELQGHEREAFSEMRAGLRRTGRRLTRRELAWASEVWERLRPFDIEKVPAGRPVVVPAVLRAPLPLKPPGRK